MPAPTVVPDVPARAASAPAAPARVDVVEYGTRRVLVVGAVMLAALLQLADTTIVNVSMPTIDGNLGASIDEGTWFVSAYIMANVVMIPLSPWFQTRLGRKTFFAIAIGGFTVTSLMCGLASDVPTEIACRTLQGAFGGGLMVPAQQIIRDSFPPEKLAMSQTLFGVAATVGPTIGPTIGGILTDAFSWRYVFFINVLPGLVAVVLVLLFVRDPEAPKRSPVDAAGIALLATGLAALQFVLEEGERNDWFEDGGIRAAACLAAVALALFVVRELVTRAPAVEIRVLRARAVWATSLVNFAFGFGLYAMFVTLPIYTQSVLGFTTTGSGLSMMVRAGTVLAMFPLVSVLVSRRGVDLRVVVASGLALYGLASWTQAGIMTTTAGFAALVPTQVAGGIGIGLIFVPLNVALLRALPLRAVPSALGVTRLAQQIGGSVASASIVTIADRAFAQHQDALRSGIAGSNVAVVAYLRTSPHGGLQHLAALVAAQAQALSLADATRVVAVVALLSAALPFLLPRRPA